MPIKTNLDYVQDILSALDSDEVNSISDTTESLQVARILKRIYDGIVTRADLNEHYTLFQLTPSDDATKPTIMYRPDDVDSILWIKYNGISQTNPIQTYQEVCFVDMDEFLYRMYKVPPTLVNNSFTYTIGTGTEVVNINGYNDRAPRWYTTFDDKTLIFDSYDAGVDTTLQSTKSLAYGKKDQSFQMSDTFIPFLDVEFGTLLLNEALVCAFAELKQMPNQVASQWAQRAWAHTNKAKRGVDQDKRPILNSPNYGRRRC